MKYKNTPGLTIDAEHVYRMASEILPGVSEVIKDVGLTDDRWFTEEHSSRGTAVHEILAGYARGLSFDPDLLDPDLTGWVKSGTDFIESISADGERILGVEVMRAHPLYRYAGTMDLISDWNGYECLWDFKTGKAAKSARFQLGAYDTLLGPTGNGKPRKRAAVELQRDGSKARIIAYNSVEHFHDGNTFLAFLTTSRVRKLYGQKNPE